MKKIILIRHADASFHANDDFQRQLSSFGREQLEHLQQHLKWIDRPEKTLVRVSTAVRTQQTFEALKSQLSTDTILREPSMYECNRTTLLQLIHATDDQYDATVLVGHNPSLTDLINYLTFENHFCETASIHVLMCDANSWRDVDAHQEYQVSLYV